MSGEVVRLPTASRRIVKQPSRHATRAAYRDANPWPGKFQWPFERQIEADSRARTDLGQGDPAYVLAIALYAALEPAQRLAARRMLALGAVARLPAFRATLERLDELADLLRRDAESVARIASRADATE
jgi:hypothetical protein